MENNGSSNFSVFTVLSHSKITAAKIAAHIKSVNGEELINCLGKLKEVRRSRVIHRAVWRKLYQRIVMQVRQPTFYPVPKVQDNVEGRFKLIVLYLCMLL